MYGIFLLVAPKEAIEQLLKTVLKAEILGIEVESQHWRRSPVKVHSISRQTLE